MGLFISLTLSGQRAGDGKMWLDRAHLPLFGTQRGQGDWSFSVHGVPTGPVRCTRAASGASFDTAAGSDVHLKLSLIPNCVLPVVIVQVVHFYFGVFH